MIYYFEIYVRVFIRSTCFSIGFKAENLIFHLWKQNKKKNIVFYFRIAMTRFQNIHFSRISPRKTWKWFYILMINSPTKWLKLKNLNTKKYWKKKLQSIFSLIFCWNTMCYFTCGCIVVSFKKLYRKFKICIYVFENVT